MNELTEFKFDILASIDMVPCTLEELKNRNFLKNKSEFGICWAISCLIKDGYIRQTGNKLLSYKAKSKKVLTEKGYYG